MGGSDDDSDWADEDADAAAGIGEDADDSKIAVENPLSFATIRCDSPAGT